MGYSQTWIAITGKLPSETLAFLGLRRTGVMEEFPESPVTCTILPSGAFLIVTDRDPQYLLRDEVLRQLSLGCTITRCSLEEHVMISSASEWRDGQCVWSLVHDCHFGLEHLAREGEVPKLVEPIHEELLGKLQTSSKKDRCDFVFDVPLKVAEVLTGFRHDEDVPGLAKDPFEVLELASDKWREKRWWEKWFGKSAK